MEQSESKKGFWDTFYFNYIPGKYFLLFFAVTLLGVLLNCNPPGFLGGFVICSVFGIFLDKVGESIPGINKYLGGGSFVAIFGAAILAWLNVFPEDTTKLIGNFVRSMDYIGWVVGGLICGSILTMDRKVLIRAGALYFIPILAGIAIAFSATAVIGAVMGFGWRQAILFVALPIMGGGTSAGAVPTALTYAANMSQENSYYLSLIMPAVVIGNALAVVAAGALDGFGRRYPSTTGNGQLMRSTTAVTDADRVKLPVDVARLGRGFIITGLFYTVGIIFAKVIFPSWGIHYYAWTILACAACKIFNIFPKGLEEDIYQWYTFMIKVQVPCVLFSIGFVYTDLGVVIANMSFTYCILVLATLIGAILGPWFVGKWLGFYPVEAAITAGLCMANMGGSGDIATLGAAKRMELMPFAQISSRLGGAIIIILASILSRVIGAGL